MKRFVEGEDRRQAVLLPEYLDDYVSEENPVRVIDVFVGELDLGALGFAGVVPEATGRPAYHPGLLLKIYVYGYINQLASSRRLERESQRNVELMWLTGRLAPDFKTIADFRKDNGPAIRATCRRFIDLCRRLDLFSHAVAAFEALEPVVHAAPDQQVSLTDPDARSMATSGRGSGTVGYNVQAAVDAKHHLIVAHEVTNVGNDRAQLANMASQAKAAMGADALDVLADRGYFSSEEVLACEPLGVTPYVPKPLTSGSKAKGRFGKQDFVYVADDDVYRCPAGEKLTRHFSSVEDGMTMHVYWTTMCGDCSLKPQCTSGKERRIKRWEHEAVIDAMRRSGWTGGPTPCASAEQPSSTPSVRSRPGWAPPTSRPEPSTRSKRR